MATKEKIPGRGMLLTSFGWIAILLSYFGTFALGLILPYMCEEMGLDSVSLGSSLSSLAFLVKVIVYIPLAMFAARRACGRCFPGLMGAMSASSTPPG